MYIVWVFMETSRPVCQMFLGGLGKAAEFVPLNNVSQNDLEDLIRCHLHGSLSKNELPESLSFFSELCFQ